MVDGEDAGVVPEPLFPQDLQRPERFFRNGIARCPVSDNRFSREGLQYLFRFPDFLPECLPRLLIDQFVRVAMTGDLVALGLDTFDEGGEAIGEPA